MDKLNLEPGKYVVAVSGGVDSVVLLDLLATQPDLDLIVAHFDHGIREDSAENARFVEVLAGRMKLPYYVSREELGANASEALARERRYEFLRALADKHHAKIITAHHGDDVIETVAINLTRGTGWRGLAVLDSSDVVRPLLDVHKHQLLDYAKRRQLDWYEDSTNASDKYLRNRLRQRAVNLEAQSISEVKLLAGKQRRLRWQIDQAANDLLPEAGPYKRHQYIMYPEFVAIELLRTLIERDAGYRPTESQAARALLAIKVAKVGTGHNISSGVSLRFDRTDFIVQTSG